MKISQLIYFVLSLLLSGPNLQTSKNGYTIKGKIAGVPDGTLFFLIKANSRGSADTVAVTKTWNGVFEFKGRLDIIGQLYFVKMDTAVVKISSEKNTWVRLLLDNSEIILKGRLDEWPDGVIQNSTATKEYEELSSIGKEYREASEERIRLSGNDSSRQEEEKRRYGNQLLDLIRAHSNSLASPLVALNIGVNDTMVYKMIYQALSERVRKSFYGIYLQQFIQSLILRSKIGMGKQIPDFSVEDENGKMLRIHEYAKKGKLTLIDFWASWCKPCRSETPKLIKVYNEFHDKGFNIISISSDDVTTAWKKAVADDKAPWTQAIEHQQRIGKEIFDLQSIPAFILIDNEGNLIAFDRGLSTIPAFGLDIRYPGLSETIKKLLLE